MVANFYHISQLQVLWISWVRHQDVTIRIWRHLLFSGYLVWI